jgi:hypothetical protein
MPTESRLTYTNMCRVADAPVCYTAYILDQT